ncbi:MAG: tRNA threonylcarbamoyladenosine dehydratase [Candidatus Omnitrophica bacterium]|nr:tRNA threonylcarbamoyladenosine dehydratase [Candidatus Omnitrophota bacterium]
MTTERFSRTELLLGKEKLEQLQASCVCVIGLGAVGGYCLEGLARAGIGKFILVDFDILRESNINRQILALESTLGNSKVLTAQKRVLDINPQANVQIFSIFVDGQSIKEVLTLKPDLIIDAIDSLNPKIQLLTSAYKAGIPVISSMGAATRMDPTKVKVADIFDSKVCPLAARIRRRLKEEGVGRGIQCVYSEEVQNVFSLSSEAPREPGEYERGRVRRRLGSLSTMTGIFGLTMANQAVIRLSNRM